MNFLNLPEVCFAFQNFSIYYTQKRRNSHPEAESALLEAL